MRLVHHGTYAYPGEEYRAASTMLESFAGLQKTPVMYNGVEYYSVKPNRTHRYWPRFNHWMSLYSTILIHFLLVKY